MLVVCKFRICRILYILQNGFNSIQFNNYTNRFSDEQIINSLLKQHNLFQLLQSIKTFTSRQRVIEGCGQYLIESTVTLHQIIVVQPLDLIIVGFSAAFLHRENLRLILTSEGFS